MFKMFLNKRKKSPIQKMFYILNFRNNYYYLLFEFNTHIKKYKTYTLILFDVQIVFYPPRSLVRCAFYKVLKKLTMKYEQYYIKQIQNVSLCIL